MHLEAIPLIALAVVGELVPRDGGVAVLGQVNAQDVVEHVPEGEGCHCGKADIEAHHHPAHKGPGADQALCRAAGGLLHDVQVCIREQSSV